MNVFFPSNPLFFILIVWSVIWKGLAMWKAARYGQKNWYLVILIVGTFGILEILYLFRFAKKPMKIEELKFWETKTK